MFVFSIVQHFVFATGDVSSGPHCRGSLSLLSEACILSTDHQGLCSAGGKCSVNAEAEYGQGVVCHQDSPDSDQ